VTSVFGFDIRVLVCPICGAPVHVSPVGGSFTCGYCKNSIEVQPRPDQATTGSPTTEDERIKELFGQMADYKDESKNWTAQFAEVARGGVTDGNASQTLTMWQTYCQQAKSGDPEAGEYAVLLTAPLSNYYALRGEEERRRALFESTLEAVPSPAHQEIMRCRLARAALKAGEVDAARAWMASCDAAPLDLAADSDYRVSAAYVATFDHDFGRVLSLLGRTHGSIPTSVSSRLLVAVVRANALEKSGDVDEAVATLLDFAAHSEGTLAEQGMAAAVKANSWLDLCPQSVPRAIAELQAGRSVAAPAAPGQESKRHGLFGRRKS
jgi:hypothetical protein